MYYHDRMSLRNPRVREVMGDASLPVEVHHGARYELLVGLYATTTCGEPTEPSWAPRAVTACPPRTRAALEAVGERSGELWLHLLGLALELPEESPASWVARLEAVDPGELRRHLLGLHVPAWCALAGAETIERAAAGDAAAARALLANERYYAGRAPESLSRLLPLSAAETKERVLAALSAYADEVLAPHEAELRARLAADVERQRAFRGYELIERAAGGYRYETEPGFERVVLVPHVAARPWLLLCQHRTARVICYPLADEQSDPAARLVTLGRALGDPKRLTILERLRAGDATLAELADELGLAKSTTHHHLGPLRAAGLVALAGNAAGYRYVLDTAAFAEAEALLSGFVGRSL